MLSARRLMCLQRKLNEVDKKQNMNTEYLKNVLLKFLISENKQVNKNEMIQSTNSYYSIDNGTHHFKIIKFG